MDIATIKPRLKSLLEYHRGRNNAILRREIRRILEIELKDDRQLRLLIGELRRDGVPVLFSTKKPAGYYVATNLKELQEGMEAMRSYIIDECRTLRDLRIYGQRYLAKEEQGVLVI
jgi:hypothetical protein